MNIRCSARPDGGLYFLGGLLSFFAGWVAHVTPEYPTEIYTNITEKLRKDIKSPLDRLEI
ncbi:MAG: hypothetical protein QY315_06800 [Saprospiraceae bacterium]|mgnify:CR=1 FL=1|nr:MAG: hypothetical protein QY315_06800 [Saprospiraceae bacterium]